MANYKILLLYKKNISQNRVLFVNTKCQTYQIESQTVFSFIFNIFSFLIIFSNNEKNFGDKMKCNYRNSL